MHRSTTKPLAFVLTTILALSSSSASGAFFGLFENSVSNMGVAHAGGSAIVDDATTIWYNPAGLTRLEGSQFSVGGHLILPSTEFDPTSATTALGAPITGGDGGDAGEDAVIPHLYYSRPLNDRLTFGLGVNVPFGLSTEYDDGWVGRFHAIRSEVETININPAVGFKINDRFSIGVGVSIQRADATLTQAVDFPTICAAAACGLPVTEGKAKLQADDTNLGANIGLLWQVGDDTRIGVAYRSAMTHELEGDVDYATDALTALFAANPAVNIVDSDLDVDVTFPASISLSAYHQLNSQWAIMGDVTQVRWARFPELRIKFDSGQSDSVLTLDLDDVERIAVGAIYKPNRSWTYRFGIAFDDTPTPNAEARTPRLPDEDRIWYTFGFNYKKDERMSIDFAYAFLDIDDAKINKMAGTNQLGENFFRGNLVGEYDADVSILSAQAHWKFQTR